MYLKCDCIEQQMFERAFQDLKHIPFSFFFEYTPIQEELSINPINIYAHSEPDEYYGRHRWLLENAGAFDYVLTWNQEVLDTFPNSQLLVYAESWVDHEDPNVIYNVGEKTFEVSFIRGNKLMAPGHQVRHEIFNRQSEIKVPTRFLPFTNTSSGLETIRGKVAVHKPSMFSLVIENTQHLNYFTEKISDCMMMKTIPIYWGCPNIGNFYDKDGIIVVSSADEAIEKMNNLTSDFYRDNIEVVERNWQKALQYRHYVNRVAEHLKKILTLHNLL